MPSVPSPKVFHKTTQKRNGDACSPWASLSFFHFPWVCGLRGLVFVSPRSVDLYIFSFLFFTRADSFSIFPLSRFALRTGNLVVSRRCRRVVLDRRVGVVEVSRWIVGARRSAEVKGRAGFAV